MIVFFTTLYSTVYVLNNELLFFRYKYIFLFCSVLSFNILTRVNIACLIGWLLLINTRLLVATWPHNHVVNTKLLVDTTDRFPAAHILVSCDCLSILVNKYQTEPVIAIILSHTFAQTNTSYERQCQPKSEQTIWCCHFSLEVWSSISEGLLTSLTEVWNFELRITVNPKRVGLFGK